MPIRLTGEYDMAMPACLEGASWTSRTARTILPLLVHRAQIGLPITYGDLDAEVVRRGWGKHAMVVNYGRSLGAIGDAIITTSKAWGMEIPPLNALVINATTGLPGDGCDDYIHRWVGAARRGVPLTHDSRRQCVEELHAELKSFDRWDELLRHYGLAALPTAADPSDSKRVPLPPPPDDGGVGGPESEEHRRLKAFVAKNPQVLGLPPGTPTGTTEFVFPSGDRADVLFSLSVESWAVEVKAANADDIEVQRGVFQCVKYQALLRAVRRAEGRYPVGRAILVSERPASAATRELAKLLGVRIVDGLVPREEGT